LFTKSELSVILAALNAVDPCNIFVGSLKRKVNAAIEAEKEQQECDD